MMAYEVMRKIRGVLSPDDESADLRSLSMLGLVSRRSPRNPSIQSPPEAGKVQCLRYVQELVIIDITDIQLVIEVRSYATDAQITPLDLSNAKKRCCTSQK
jgi:hypothetical protein